MKENSSAGSHVPPRWAALAGPQDPPLPPAPPPPGIRLELVQRALKLVSVASNSSSASSHESTGRSPSQQVHTRAPSSRGTVSVRFPPSSHLSPRGPETTHLNSTWSPGRRRARVVQPNFSFSKESPSLVFQHPRASCWPTRRMRSPSSTAGKSDRLKKTSTIWARGLEPFPLPRARGGEIALDDVTPISHNRPQPFRSELLRNLLAPWTRRRSAAEAPFPWDLAGRGTEAARLVESRRPLGGTMNPCASSSAMDLTRSRYFLRDIFTRFAGALEGEFPPFRSKIFFLGSLVTVSSRQREREPVGHNELDSAGRAMSDNPWDRLGRGSSAGRALFALYSGDLAGKKAGNTYSQRNREKFIKQLQQVSRLTAAFLSHESRTLNQKSGGTDFSARPVRLASPARSTGRSRRRRRRSQRPCLSLRSR